MSATAGARAVFAGIGDEAGWTLDTQLAALRRLGWSTIELRTVNGRAIADLDDAEFAVVADTLDRAGVRVVALDSRIGDWSRPVTGQFALDLDELRVLLRRCQALGIRQIRIMSFPNAGLLETAWRREAVRRVQHLAALAERAEVVLIHENCAGWAGDRAERMLALLDEVGSPALKLLFDTGNGVPHGYDGHELLQQIMPHVAHVHVKDAVCTGEGVQYTVPGQGQARVADCLRALLEHGYGGVLSIEPHITVRPHDGFRDDDGGAGFVRCGRALEALVAGLTRENSR